MWHCTQFFINFVILWIYSDDNKQKSKWCYRIDITEGLFKIIEKSYGKKSNTSESNKSGFCMKGVNSFFSAKYNIDYKIVFSKLIIPI